MKVLECPHTKKLLNTYKSAYPIVGIDDAKKREELISAIRPRICGNPDDRTVCCDVCKAEFFNFPTCAGNHSNLSFALEYQATLPILKS